MLPHDRDLAYWKDRANRFGAAAIGYGCNEELISWDNLLRAHAIARLVTITPNMTVLDAGTGAGYWAIRCAKAGATVTALDFSRELLDIAEANARRASVDIVWVHAALEEVDLPADYFDLAFSITCLQHITQPERQTEAVRRILRSLKPGGIFVLLEDTVVGNPTASDYMRTYSQPGWIALIRSSGAQLRRFVGVSFLRFQCRRLPVQVAVAIDLIMAYIPGLRRLATVTAFSFERA